MVRKKGSKKADETIVTEDEKTEPSSGDNEEVTEKTERQPTTTGGGGGAGGDDSVLVVDEEADMAATSTNEGPLLTSVIIKSYNGELLNGLFEGEGEVEFTDGHTYKGFFHQGLMHGYGLYKWNDGVTYQGDFMLNHITGKGTYTYLDSSTYEGEVLNGMRHGYGVYNWKSQGKCYTGYWFKGKKHGKGCMQFDEESQSFFHGDWQNDLPHGWGLERYTSNNIFEGFWFKNKPNVEGVMKWFVEGRPKDLEVYTGHWFNGVQNGYGEHMWMTYRSLNSQFNAQNLYKGNFVDGKRHGQGTFYYADGSKYKGEWFEDKKHGLAKFTQRTGEVYEGLFENNGLPSNTLIKGLPALVDQQSRYLSKEFRAKSVDVYFILDVHTLLKHSPKLDPDKELVQVSKNVWRHIAYLKKVYLFYAALGLDTTIDNVYLMTNLQFWRFLKDCCFHHFGFTLMQMDRILGINKKLSSFHKPFSKLLLREFIANLVILSYHAFSPRQEEMKANSIHRNHLLDWCFSQLLRNNIYPNVYNVKGYIFPELRKALNIMDHVEEVYHIYCAICKPRKLPPHDSSMRMRDCLVLLKDVNLINENLTAKAAIAVLAEDDPNVIVEGTYNLELEMTYLEFLEALVGFAEIYITESVVEAMTIVIETQTSQSRSSKTGSCSRLSPLVSRNVSTVSLSTILKPPIVLVDMASPSEKSVENDENLKTLSIQSPMASILEATDSKNVDTEEETESQELDQSTKKYNFWTHQIHIFFIEKFILPVKKLLNMRQVVEKKVTEELKRIKKIQKQKAATQRWLLSRHEALQNDTSNQDQRNGEVFYVYDEFGTEMKSTAPPRVPYDGVQS